MIFWIAGWLFTLTLTEPNGWKWIPVFLLTWPLHLGHWMRQNFSKVEINNSVVINEEDV